MSLARRFSQTFILLAFSYPFFGMAAILESASDVQLEPGLKQIPLRQWAQTTRGTYKLSDNNLVMTAFEATDLYRSPEPAKSLDNAPRILFKPKGDFIFSAKLSADFNAAFDGAALIIYKDEGHWAKLLLERFHTGALGISSTVVRNTGDDVYHNLLERSSLYLKIVRKGDFYVFYNSVDGVSWNMLRNFILDDFGSASLGFMVQSPVGKKFTANFSAIKFEQRSFGDFWQGN